MWLQLSGGSLVAGCFYGDGMVKDGVPHPSGGWQAVSWEHWFFNYMASRAG